MVGDPKNTNSQFEAIRMAKLETSNENVKSCGFGANFAIVRQAMCSISNVKCPKIIFICTI